MKREWFFWVALIAVFTTLLILEGRRYRALEAELALTPDELFQNIARAQVRHQIIDARADAEEYLDTHIPGAIPFPGCDPSAASEWVIASAPSVIVSSEGERDVFEKCRRYFTNARNLAGGMTAWSDEGLPEDEGEYLPPSNSAGGGCL